MTFYIINCIHQNLTPGCRGNAFPLLSYRVDTSTRMLQEAQDVGFPKMYGRNCHLNGTGFRSGPWTRYILLQMCGRSKAARITAIKLQ